jgi:hypothetical protein
MKSLSAIHIFLSLLLASTSVAAAPPTPEKVGTWRFKDASKPIKVINLGGSVAAWPRGSYSQFIQAACKRVEVVNRAKARIGALQLRERFTKQVRRNRRLALKTYEETWLIFQGGLNSLGTPHRTNKNLRDIFARAHAIGIQSVGLTLGPWGNAKRWRGADGLDAYRRTRLAVDFILGRLEPEQALGRYGKGRNHDTWKPGELPTIAVDMFDSDLRDRDADPLTDKRLRHRLRYHKKVAKELKLIPKVAREAALDQLESEARALSRQFMAPKYMAFDSIHPNMEGHRVMAQTMCPKLPTSWGCSCEAIAEMQWVVKEGGLVPRVE